MKIYNQGRLVLGDGSIYDGLWRHGKRSGIGTFYFKNGDMFQGSWRDDVMHGKVCTLKVNSLVMIVKAQDEQYIILFSNHLTVDMLYLDSTYFGM